MYIPYPRERERERGRERERERERESIQGIQIMLVALIDKL
jgi:hypothetical protein